MPTSANSGMTVNWVRQPMSISLGRLSTTLKSAGESVSPIPNMMAPSMGLMAHVSIHTNDAGTVSDNAATTSTITPIQRAMKSHNFFILKTSGIQIALQKYKDSGRTPKAESTFLWGLFGGFRENAYLCGVKTRKR